MPQNSCCVYCKCIFLRSLYRPQQASAADRSANASAALTITDGSSKQIPNIISLSSTARRSGARLIPRIANLDKNNLASTQVFIFEQLDDRALAPTRATAVLFAKRVNTRRKSQDDRIRQAVFALLHSPPSTYGINRTTRKMADRQEILRTQGHSVSRHLIRTFIEAAGYKWRRARTVLTSKDPNYQTKVDDIVKILTGLKIDEAFFSIDEFGPFAVKKRGGRKRVGPQETYTVPQ